ncbi:MAG TPA: glycerol-3-phosphate 1-O-acyltransferase PlsY [Candidatus Choladousia intestinavium]|uniref:Glycerol-3-phosphate acyltransferase n=1 Tax=Candidatus Choladousia intestinavium TaxID=2840727 RepID=A0A9D1AE52_9FIRM|nr:glycerol-3-phosphate 1-O-acyltransferase PlsY [Candidatus Choladousia intestinavium]
MTVRVLCLCIGYLFGLLQTSYIYGKLHGIDIRQYGSGNAGTTNMLRTMGTKAGIITFFFDFLKCFLAVMAVRLLFGNSYSDIIPLLSVYTGAGVILGHNYPFYLKFKGGKGIAATAGLIVSLGWQMTLLAIVTFFGTTLLTHLVSLGSLLLYAGFMIEVIIFGQLGIFGMTQGHLYEMYTVVAALTVLAFWKHRTNLARLVRGEERKTYLFKKNRS